MNIIDQINNSESLTSLTASHILPQPYADEGYYFIYYSRKDYKEALRDIVLMAENELRVWYDAKKNYEEKREAEMLIRAQDLHCFCVVLYLSKNAMSSPFFWKLCELILERHLPYCTINLPDENGNVSSGLDLATSLVLSERQKFLAEKLFAPEITFIPGTITFEEKLLALKNVRKNEILIFGLEGQNAIVMGVKELSYERIVIPERVLINQKEYTVKRIAPRAFARCKRLKEIYIPDCIEHIGELLSDSGEDIYSEFMSHNKEGFTFQDCISLEEIRLPSSLRTICTNLFEGCVNLKRVHLGNSIVRIKGNPYFSTGKSIFDAFDYEREEKYLPLEELILPNTFLRRFDGVILSPDIEKAWKRFYVSDQTKVSGYTQLGPIEHYVLEKGERVGERFVGDVNLRSIDMRLGVEEELLDTFCDCINLERVCLPNCTFSISQIFMNCQALRQVSLPESLKMINGNSFQNCCSLQELVIPKNVDRINDNAFDNSTIETITFDSISNKKFLKSMTFIQNKYNSLLIKPEKKNLLKPLFYFASPFYILLVLFCTLFTRLWYIGAVGLMTFPISIWFFLFYPVTRPFYLNSYIKTMYLRKYNKRSLKIKGYRRVESDREGYDKYLIK